jgi:general secretion pathway protein G
MKTPQQTLQMIMKNRGFTLIELMVTLTLLSILALTALPLAEVVSTRAKEYELRLALRQIRTAIDKYKAAGDASLIAKTAGESGYPASLEILTLPLTTGKDITQGSVIFLRSVPRDPFHPDPTANASSTWALRSYASPVNDPQPGNDVFDVHSLSQKTGLNGVRYDQW